MAKITKSTQREIHTDKAGLNRLREKGFDPKPAYLSQTMGPHWQNIIWHVFPNGHKVPYYARDRSYTEIMRALA